MADYREVGYIFEGPESHAVASGSLIRHPYRDGDVFIMGQNLFTMDDGIEIEICLWNDGNRMVWDVSVDKAMLVSRGLDFLSYLRSKGVYLESVKDEYCKWFYAGTIKMKDVYRIQYVEEDSCVLEIRYEENECI